MADYQAQSQALPGYATSTNLSHGQQPAASRILHVYHEGFSHRRIHILDSDKQTPVYRIEANSGGLFSSKPHVRINGAATNAEVATITFHSMSSNIDMAIQDRPILLSKSGFLTSAHDFRILATGGCFKWKRDGMFGSGDLLCLDEREQLVARLKAAVGRCTKRGSLNSVRESATYW